MTHISFTNISLVKASHVAMPTFIGGEKYISCILYLEGEKMQHF